MVEAAQTAVLEIAPLLDAGRIQDQLLFFLDKLMDCTPHEVRSAVTHLYAKLGPALQDCEGCENLLQNVLLPRLLERAGDSYFQVRRVCAVSSSTLGPNSTVGPTAHQPCAQIAVVYL